MSKAATGGASRRSDLVWGFAAILLQYGASLLVLPVLLRHLSPDEVGLWYAFHLLLALAVLLEMGYAATFVRNLAYAHAGMGKLQAEGLDAGLASQGAEPNFRLVSALIVAMERRYRTVGLGMFALLAAAGTPYIVWLARDLGGQGQLALHWLVFAGAGCAGFYMSRWSSELMGLQRVRSAQQAQIATRLLAVLFTAGGVLGGYGVGGAVMGYAAGTLLGGAVTWMLFRQSDVSMQARRSARPSAIEVADVEQAIRSNAHRTGVVQIGGFLTQRGVSLCASAFMALGDFAAFSLTLQVLQVLFAVSRVRMQLRLPALSRYAAAGESLAFKAEVQRSLLSALVVYGAGGLVLVVVGHELLHWIGSRVMLVAPSALLVLLLAGAADLLQALCAWALNCFNKVLDALSSVLTGLALCIACLALGFLGEATPLTFALAQAAAVCAYSGWRWPLELRRRLATG